MKTLSTINANRWFRSTLTIVAIIASLMITNNVHATGSGDVIKVPGVEIQYLGNVDYKPVFKVEFENESEEELYLTLKDASGSTFYTEVIKDKKYSKKFQFENADVNGLQVTVTLRSKKNSYSQVFEINKSIRQIEDVVIEKVK